MEMTLQSLMQQYCELKKMIFDQHSLNMEISLNTQRKSLTFCMCILHYHVKGTVSQNLYLGLTFSFMNSRKLSLKK